MNIAISDSSGILGAYIPNYTAATTLVDVLLSSIPSSGYIVAKIGGG